MKSSYAHAIAELLRDGADVSFVLSRAKDVMKAHGHESLYGAVLKEAVTLLETAELEAKATLTVASAKDADTAEVKALLASLATAPTDVTTTIDPTIIGGAVVRYNNRLLDKSYKTALTSLYQSITTN